MGVTDDIPTAPTPASPALSRLTITPIGGGSLPIGGTAPLVTSGALPSNGVMLGAFAEYTSGPGRYVEAAWTSSDASVLAVEANTLVARRAGTTTLTASFEGKSDTEQFVVEPGVAGRWAGSYAVQQCNASSGSMQDVLCRPTSGIAPVGAMLPFTMAITESGTELTGTVSFGQVRGELKGSTRGNGLFALGGTITFDDGAVTITHWDARVTGDTMEGFVTYQVRLDGLPGLGQVNARLANMKRQ